MDWIIKKASSLSSEELAHRGLTGIPQDWPVEMSAYKDEVLAGFELISDGDLAQLQVDNQSAYDVWYSTIKNPPIEPPKFVISSTDPFITTVRYPAFAVINEVDPFRVTPPFGVYSCVFTASSFYSAFPKFHKVAFFKNDVMVEESLHSQDSSKSNHAMIDMTQAVISCSGYDEISVRVSCDTVGALTIGSRTLILTRR